MSTPDKKRKIEHLEDSIPLECHGTLWYEDGNVIVVAETTLFRAHQGILSSQSNVLKGLIVMAEPEEGTPQKPSDACPKITLNDSKEDVQRLIESLYDAKCIKSPQISFILLSTWLRLGTKYKVEHLRTNAMDHLFECYPNTLQGFSSINSRLASMQPIEIHVPSGSDTAEEFAVCQLAFHYELWSLLPAALYRITRWYTQFWVPVLDQTMEELGKGIPRYDDQIIAKALEGRDELHRRVLCGKLGLLEGKICTDSTCRSALLKALRELWKNDAKGFMSCGLFGESSPAIVKQVGLCKVCIAKAAKHWRETQETVWAELPSIFDIELSAEQWPGLAAKEVHGT